jgi:hypothetical protein
METDPKGVRIAPATIERILKERDRALRSCAEMEAQIVEALQADSLEETRRILAAIPHS